MNKVLVTAPGKLELTAQPDPPLGPHDVRIGVRLSGLSSRSEIERYQRNPAGKPEEIGYNAVGVIEEAGSEVSRVKVGNRVYAPVGHADRPVVDAAKVIPLPDGVDDESACFAYLPTLGIHALRLAGYQPGEFVAIVGQGIIGQTAALMALHYGARTIVIDVCDTRLDLARRNGVQYTINPRQEDAAEAVARICGPVGLDIVVDTASSWRSLSQALHLIRPHGRVVMLGIIRDAPTADDAAAFFDAYRRNMHSKEATVIGASNDPNDPEGVTGLRFTRERNIEEVLNHVASGTLNLGQLITHRYPISELEPIYQLLLNGGGEDHLGVVFTWPATGASA
jgi:threonine dehydrogenase-like Zn-dependent dehydrogenase